MRREPNTPHRGTVLVACVGTLAALAAGCSSGASKVTTSTTTPPTASSTSTATNSSPSAPSVSSTTPTTAPSTTSAGTDLSGTWSGRYSGTYSGTFNLSWQQRGSSLSGRITLSATASTQRLNGTVKGTKITFGTVGSAAITYSGTVSGNSMSGAYHVGGTSGGNWSATKSS
jgi:peptidoglycan DL-endopeptidase CwlO